MTNISASKTRRHFGCVVGMMLLSLSVAAALHLPSSQFTTTTTTTGLSHFQQLSHKKYGAISLIKHNQQTKTKNHESPIDSRRNFLASSAKAASLLGFLLLSGTQALAEDGVQVTAEELDAIYAEDASNNPPLPDVPQAPEERSGLVVLRIAEVAQFQEQILRSIVEGKLEGVKVAPLQFSFGTRILLKNSNLDGNMKLMIAQEIPKSERTKAARNASNCMNILQDIIVFSNNIQRDFEPLEMIELADKYKLLRINLNQLYEYLPQTEKDKYYGYFVAVTEYEKKIADGVYNPDIDGVLKFD